MEFIIWKGPQAHPGGGRSLRRQTALRGLHGLYGGELPVAPKLEYSGCTMQPGWNIKFKKNGKNVCTLYPLDGYFICMILIGGDAMAEMEARLGDFTPYIQGSSAIPEFFQEAAGCTWRYGSRRWSGTWRAGISQAALHGPDARSGAGKRKENGAGKRKG